jgi:hypothetical protein
MDKDEALRRLWYSFPKPSKEAQIAPRNDVVVADGRTSEGGVMNDK